MVASKLAASAAATFTLTSYGVAWSCIVIAILYQFSILLPFWTWEYRNPDSPWESFRTVTGINYAMIEESKLFTGWDSMMLVFTWLPPPIAIIATMLPALLLSKTLRQAAWELKPMMAMARWFRRARRVAMTPMWPHKFWLWWCNGFTVFDFFIWGGFLALNIIGVAELTNWYKRNYQGWDAIGLTYAQPKSVYNLEWISLAFSWTLYFPFTFLFFPVAHVSFLHTLLGTSWASFVKYHRWLGQFTLWLVTGHAIFYYLYWICNSDLNFWDEALDWNTLSSINYLAGSIAWLGGVALWLTSLSWVRRRFFKVFYVTHIGGFLVFIVFIQIHYYWSWLYIMPGLIVWGVDVVFRVFQAQHASAVSSAQLTPSGNLVRLDIPLDPHLAKSMRAGQDVLLQFPSISRWWWHPFTIYKVNMPSQEAVAPSMTIAIKKYGGWTKKLLAQLEMSGACIPVRVVGPVGGLHSLGAHASRVIMFVGGIGASPALAHVNAMIDSGSKPPTTLVFVARDVEEFSILDERLLKEAGRQDKSWLTIKLFLTGTSGSMKNAAKLDHSTDSPPTSVPGGMEPKLKTLSSSGGSMERAGPGGVAVPSPVADVNGLSAFGWNPFARPMQPRLLNDWQLLLAIILAWLGGFLGAVQAQSGLIEKWYPGWTEHDSWAIGLMFLGCISVQMVGLPALLVVFPVQVYQYFKSKRQVTSMVAIPESPYIQGHLGGDLVGSLEVAPPLVMTYGRPNVRELLAETLQGATGEEVPVVVAGPTSMLHQVELDVWGFNWKRGAGIPYLHIIRETFEM